MQPWEGNILLNLSKVMTHQNQPFLNGLLKHALRINILRSTNRMGPFLWDWAKSWKGTYSTHIFKLRLQEWNETFRIPIPVFLVSKLQWCWKQSPSTDNPILSPVTFHEFSIVRKHFSSVIMSKQTHLFVKTLNLQVIVRQRWENFT